MSPKPSEPVVRETSSKQRKPPPKWEEIKSPEQIAVFQREFETGFTPPPFTYQELKDCIPPELFQRSTFKSTLHLIPNLLFCFGLMYISTWIDSTLPAILAPIAWITYWVVQGIAGSCLWVIGHECGHYAFSPYDIVNDVLGFIIHTSLLAPYFSWQISHKQHHSSGAHMERDTVFVPKRRLANKEQRKPRSPLQEAWKESPIRKTGLIAFGLTFGWFLYLLNNSGGQSYTSLASHFLPSSPIFKDSQRRKVFISNLGLVAMFGVLIYLSHIYSLSSVVKYYWMPLMVVNTWLVIFTLLHHTDVYIPHYSEKSWTFVRGALATVDRDIGWFLNYCSHHIVNSHVVHHLFSKMPHYNAIKATPYIKAKLGDYYLEDKTPLHWAIWRVANNCVFVENDRDVLFYRNK